MSKAGSVNELTPQVLRKEAASIRAEAEKQAAHLERTADGIERMDRLGFSEISDQSNEKTNDNGCHTHVLTGIVTTNAEPPPEGEKKHDQA